MRTPLKSRSSGAAKRRPGFVDARSAIARRARRSRSASARRRPRCAPSDRRRSACDHAVAAGHTGTRPGDGRRPTTLQKLAGLRSEPPMSLPSAIGSIPVASATAAPPLLPPQVLVRSYGIQRRSEHRVERLRAGAELRRVRLADDDRAGAPEALDEQRILGRHEVACRSASRTSCGCLWSAADPCARSAGRAAGRRRGRGRAPRRPRARAAIACSATSVTIALTPGLTRSICARCAPTTSRADSSFARIRRASSTALSWQMSDVTSVQVESAATFTVAPFRLAPEGLHYRSEIIERRGDAAAGERHAGRREPHLDAAQACRRASGR